MKLPGSTEHYDIYLGKNLYPVLLPAVEALSKEYDRQQLEYSKCPNKITQLESIASGVPVIAYKGTVSEEIIKNGVSGYLVDEINIDEIKEPILACPNDPDDVKLLSEVAGDKIDEVFIGSCMTNIGHFRARK